MWKLFAPTPVTCKAIHLKKNRQPGSRLIFSSYAITLKRTYHLVLNTEAMSLFSDSVKLEIPIIILSIINILWALYGFSGDVQRIYKATIMFQHRMKEPNDQIKFVERIFLLIYTVKNNCQKTGQFSIISVFRQLQSVKKHHTTY